MNGLFLMICGMVAYTLTRPIVALLRIFGMVAPCHVKTCRQSHMRRDMASCIATSQHPPSPSSGHYSFPAA